MKITKYDQSCVIIEKNGRKMIIDPVEFSTKIPITGDVDVILVTHNHSDHLTPEVLANLIKENLDVVIVTTQDNMEIGATRSVKDGDELIVGEFELKFFGKNHAPIIDGEIPCDNIGVVVDNSIIHPGDSYDIPPVKAKILLPAVSAPWLKTYETMQYIKSVDLKIVIPIHDALFSEVGKRINGSLVKKTCDEIGAEYRELKPGESVEVEDE